MARWRGAPSAATRRVAAECPPIGNTKAYKKSEKSFSETLPRPFYDGPNGSFFYFDTNSQFRIPKSEFRILKSEFRILKSEFRILKSEFRILNSEFRISKKNVVYRNFVFGDDTSGFVHGVGRLI